MTCLGAATLQAGLKADEGPELTRLLERALHGGLCLGESSADSVFTTAATVSDGGGGGQLATATRRPSFSLHVLVVRACPPLASLIAHIARTEGGRPISDIINALLCMLCTRAFCPSSSRMGAASVNAAAA